MAHSVSEAAARAVKNSLKVAVETRTPEQRISDIRKNRAAKLFVTPDEQDFLLAQYDAERVFSHKLAVENADLKAQVATLEVLQAEIAAIRSALKTEA